MIAPPKPVNEASRLRALHDLDLLDTRPQERFDRFTRLAARSFRMPIALITLVDEKRQWFLSRQGLDAVQTSREASFCGHTILEAEVMVVPDAIADERFADNPLVIDDPQIRFYAGCPIAAPDGSRIGTLCLIDRQPRSLDDDDVALLRDLARMVEDDIAIHALATIDCLTGLSNRRGFDLLACRTLRLCKRLSRPASLLFIDIDEFKTVNDTLGHDAGDRTLRAFADLLIDGFRDSDVIGRLGGDEFCVLLADSSTSKAPAERLQRVLEEWNRDSRRPHALRCSIGVADFDPTKHEGLDDLIREADRFMYAIKRARRNASTA